MILTFLRDMARFGFRPALKALWINARLRAHPPQEFDATEHPVAVCFVCGATVPCRERDGRMLCAHCDAALTAVVEGNARKSPGAG